MSLSCWDAAASLYPTSRPSLASYQLWNHDIWARKKLEEAPTAQGGKDVAAKHTAGDTLERVSSSCSLGCCIPQVDQCRQSWCVNP
mmetsp:Transcript_27643/g.57842  ORF Transcript_27643/g.57842 Transcript_27643/m.57842 type:complete len:86 (+) Transcript_27643:727-984(+)